jgi:hypothetical protein
MRNMRWTPRLTFVAIALGTLSGAAGTQTASASATRPAEPSQAEIRRTVAELGHPVPARRQIARRQLVRWGSRVTAELQRVSQGANLEAALEARDLLKELESAFFHGGSISLQVDRSAVAWDEPFALTVVVRNPTSGPIRVTWAAPGTAPASRPANDDVTQVAAMFDIADFLVVRGPDDQEVDLRIDPIERDPAVRAAVGLRAKGTPPSYLLEAGGTARLRIPGFNRGWARYPMLEPGKYRITVCYQPAWKDESWVAEKVGLTESPPVEVQVRSAAPEVVLSANRPMRLITVRSGADLVVELQNLWDRSQWVNLDLGSDLEAQALLHWRVTAADKADAEPVTITPQTTSPRRSDRMPELGPGEKIEVARVTVRDLWEAVRAAGISQPGSFDLAVRYQFMVGLEEFRASLAVRKRKIDVPTHLFTGTPTSDEIRVRLPDETK